MTAEVKHLQATNMIDLLRKTFIGDRFYLDREVAQRLSGDHNKEFRREIIREITGETRPLSKCGMYAVADVLKAHFEQLTLF